MTKHLKMLAATKPPGKPSKLLQVPDFFLRGAECDHSNDILHRNDQRILSQRILSQRIHQMSQGERNTDSFLLNAVGDTEFVMIHRRRRCVSF